MSSKPENPRSIRSGFCRPSELATRHGKHAMTMCFSAPFTDWHRVPCLERNMLRANAASRRPLVSGSGPRYCVVLRLWHPHRVRLDTAESTQNLADSEERRRAEGRRCPRPAAARGRVVAQKGTPRGCRAHHVPRPRDSAGASESMFHEIHFHWHGVAPPLQSRPGAGSHGPGRRRPMLAGGGGGDSTCTWLLSLSLKCLSITDCFL